MTYLLIFNAVVLTILWQIWTSKTWLNTFIKLALLGGAIANAITLASLLGYVVHG